jgi:hypothetical protein
MDVSIVWRLPALDETKELVLAGPARAADISWDLTNAVALVPDGDPVVHGTSLPRPELAPSFDYVSSVG